MSNELSTPKILACPADTRAAANNFVRLKNQNVSYFVGLDANESSPQMFLAGDRNITADNEPEKGILKLVPSQRVSWTQAMHVNPGNIGLSDGSVQNFQFRVAAGASKFRRSGQHLADFAAGITLVQIAANFYFEFRRFLRQNLHSLFEL